MYSEELLKQMFSVESRQKVFFFFFHLSAFSVTFHKYNQMQQGKTMFYIKTPLTSVGAFILFFLFLC